MFLHGTLSESMRRQASSSDLLRDETATATATVASDASVEPEQWTYSGAGSMDDFRIVGVAGKGAASVVYRANVVAVDGLCVALKKTVPYGDGGDEERTAREIAALRRARHPSVVRLLGAFRALDGEGVVLLEYCELGSLKTVLRILRQGAVAEARLAGADAPRYVGISEQYARNVVWDLVRGLEHLHRAPDVVVHRDIKPDNVLMTKQGTAKLADFGLADFVGEQRLDAVVGTPWYMAPEILSDAKPGYTAAVDVYALGITVIAMLEGEPPHWKEEPMPMLDLLRKGAVVPRLKHEPDFSRELVAFVESCVALDPAQRRAAADLLSAPWINEPLRHADGGRRLVKLVRKALLQGGTSTNEAESQQSRADAKMVFKRAAPQAKGERNLKVSGAFGAHRALAQSSKDICAPPLSPSLSSESLLLDALPPLPPLPLADDLAAATQALRTQSHEQLATWHKAEKPKRRKPRKTPAAVSAAASSNAD
jgi:serine/threonine protein kinase